MRWHTQHTSSERNSPEFEKSGALVCEQNPTFQKWESTSPVSAGQNVLRILPPLVIEESHIAEAIEKISAGARSFKEAKAA